MFYKIILFDHETGEEYFIERCDTLESARRRLEMCNLIRLITRMDDRYMFSIQNSDGDTIF